ncbi:MAG: hypothetical protein NXI24_10600 [bacterium]|nr:hypothetical protein [bacterium]
MYGHPFVGIFPEDDSDADSDLTTLSLLGLAGFAAAGGACVPTLFNGSFTGCPLSLGGIVTTPYGPAAGSNVNGDADGVGNAARFSQPADITTDGTFFYVADLGNNKIRRIDPATGAVTTPYGPAAGSTASGDTDGTGNAARFTQPSAITTDGTHLYVTDFGNNKIRRIVIATGVVTTLAGPAPGSTAGGDTDGTGNAARFTQPFGIAYDGAHLYVADFGNNKIRRIDPTTGVVTTPYGPSQGNTAGGDADGFGNAARFQNPQGIAISLDGANLYISDATNNKIRQIAIATGAVTTLAGPAPGSTANGDADGVGNAARFRSPLGIFTDGTSLYVPEFTNHKVRQIDLASRSVSTLAGPAPGSNASGDLDGTGNAAFFNQPGGLLSDGTQLYIADIFNNKIRLIR